jgi:hypothetical protein
MKKCHAIINIWEQEYFCELYALHDGQHEMKGNNSDGQDWRVNWNNGDSI